MNNTTDNAMLAHSASEAGIGSSQDDTPSPWELLSTSKTYHVPLAEGWHYVDEIKDSNGRLVYRLLQEDRIGLFGPGIPILRMVVGDATGRVVAVIVREISKGRDRYTVYGRDHQPEPSSTTDANPLQCYRLERNGEEIELTAVVSIIQGALGKQYTVWSHDHPRQRRKKKIWWKAENASFRKILLCCPCVIFLGICAWEFEFYDLNARSKMRWLHPFAKKNQASQLPRTETPIFTRDQEARTMTVAAGGNPLLGLCVSYALDRFTRPLY